MSDDKDATTEEITKKISEAEKHKNEANEYFKSL